MILLRLISVGHVHLGPDKPACEVTSVDCMKCYPTEGLHYDPTASGNLFIKLDALR